MKTTRFSLIAKFSSLVFSSMICLATTANAEHVSADGREWANVVRSNANVRYGAIDLATNPLPPAVSDGIAVIAEDQAQGWADTILEGDFLADDAVQIESIESVHSETDFLGYRVTYSSAAYDTSNCDAVKNITDCQAGRIVEASVISPALDSWLRDRHAYAEFVPAP